MSIITISHEAFGDGRAVAGKARNLSHRAASGPMRAGTGRKPLSELHALSLTS